MSAQVSGSAAVGAPPPAKRSVSSLRSVPGLPRGRDRRRGLRSLELPRVGSSPGATCPIDAVLRGATPSSGSAGGRSSPSPSSSARRDRGRCGPPRMPALPWPSPPRSRTQAPRCQSLALLHRQSPRSPLRLRRGLSGRSSERPLANGEDPVVSISVTSSPPSTQVSVENRPWRDAAQSRSLLAWPTMSASTWRVARPAKQHLLVGPRKNQSLSVTSRAVAP